MKYFTIDETNNTTPCVFDRQDDLAARQRWKVDAGPAGGDSKKAAIMDISFGGRMSPIGLMRLVTVLFLLSPTAVVFGQALNFGSFAGTVRDPSGAAIAQAKVRIIRVETTTV